MKIPPIKTIMRFARAMAEACLDATATALDVGEAQRILGSVEHDQVDCVIGKYERQLRELIPYMNPTQLEAYRETTKQAAAVCDFRDRLITEATENNTKTIGHLHIANANGERITEIHGALALEETSLRPMRKHDLTLVGRDN